MRKGRYIKVNGMVIEYKKIHRSSTDKFNRCKCPNCFQKTTNIYYGEPRTQKRKVIGFYCHICNHSYMVKSKIFNSKLVDYNDNEIEYKYDLSKGGFNK